VRSGFPRAVAAFGAGPHSRNDLAPASTNHFHERLLDFGKRRADRRAPRINDDVPPRRESGAVYSKRLAETALDTVSDDGATQGSRGCDTQAGTANREFMTWNRAVGAGETECRKQRIRDAQTLVINDSKIGGAQNPCRFRKGQRGPRCAAGGGVRWIWQSVLLFRR